MTLKKLIITFLILILSVFSYTAHCTVNFKAQNFTHDQTNKEIHAIEHVIIQTTNGEIIADEVWIDTERNQIKGRGNVFLRDSEITIQSESFNYNLDSNTGNFENFLLSAKSVSIKGEKLERLGKDHYFITQGSYSPCKGYCKDWQIAGATIDITIEGYAVLTHALIMVREVPISYAPLIILPAKTKRTTGFLFPYFSYLKNIGSKFSIPFFIDISNHTDLILTPNIYTARGFGLKAEHRYMMSRYWHGITSIDYIQEYFTDENEAIFAIMTDNTAYFDTSNITISLKGSSASQNRYVQEYVVDSKYSGLSSTAQSFFAAHGFKALNTSVRIEFIQDVMLRDRIFENQDYFIFPWIKTQTSLWHPFSWLCTSVEGEMIHTRRFKGGNFDQVPSPENIIVKDGAISSTIDEDTSFDQNDIAVTVIRYGLIPRVYSQASLFKTLNWKSEFKIPYRYFVLPESKFATLTYPEFNENLSISLEHIYGNKQSEGIRHLITPSLVHVYRPQIIKTGSKFYFDGPNYGMSTSDTILSSHSFSIVLINSLTKKTVNNDYQTLLSYGISWGLFTDSGIILEPDQVVQPVGPINTGAQLNLKYLSINLTTTTDLNNNYKTDLTNKLSTSPLSWLSLSVYSTSIDYVDHRSLQSKFILSLKNIFNIFQIESTAFYSFTTNTMLYHTYTININPPSSCWQAGVIFSGPEFNMLFTFNLNFGEYFGYGTNKAVPFGAFNALVSSDQPI